MNVVIRRLAIGACLVVSGLAVTVRPVSAQVTDQQVDQAAVANAPATVDFDLPAATPNISWIAPRNAPKARFSDAATAPRQASSGGVGVGALFGYTRNSTRDNAGAEFGDIFDFDSGSGWMVGIWFGGNRQGVVGFMGELSYVVKKAGDPAGGPDVELGYLEIPVLLRINIGQGSASGFRVYGLGGPVFDFKISDNADDFGLSDDAFESFDIGLMVGAGVEVARFGFEVRGNWGFREVVSTDITNNVKIKNFTLQVLGKIRFN